MVSVACVLRSGGEYKPEHVRALRNQLARFGPIHAPRFVCLTDLPSVGDGTIEVRQLREGYKGWWSKMELFAAAQDDLDDILYLDLDTMIVGTNLYQLLGIGKLTLLADFYKPDQLQSGLMFLPSKDRAYARAAWLENPELAMQQYRGDGEFLDMVWRHRATTWQREVPGQVVSYKVHCRRRGIPQGAQIVCFHGKPRPWETKLWDQ